ncbi:MAG: hypothetical protein BIFFINMI_03970 [Phycisphaerae bacterium]|nr:hypothetical protein [Phycisphaerae bacterium]
MPRLAGEDLTRALLQGFEESGAAPTLLGSPRTNPRRLVINQSAGSLSVYAYIWTLTPGGRPSLPNEYRIQMTGVAPPLRANPDGMTLLLGFEPSLEVFAGFDMHRHRIFTAGSPSVQIDIRSVRQAISDGLAVDRKENAELAFGIRPDMLLVYSHTANELHRYGRTLREKQIITSAGKGLHVSPHLLARLTAPRRRTVETVTRLSRDAAFKRLVLQAYDFRCAATGLQLRLVDAAHILPVGSPGSTDEISNGLALSPTYHRAFDSGLIYLHPSMEMRLNQARADELVRLDLGGGLTDFIGTLNRPIILPSNPSLRPSPTFIEQANRLRDVV